MCGSSVSGFKWLRFALFGVQDTDGQTAGHAEGMAEGSGNGWKQIHRYTQL